jgi:hypothetical protein
MPAEHWIKKTIAASVILALPAAGLLARVYWVRFRRGHRVLQMHLAFWIPFLVLCLFACSVINVVSNWSVAFMISWPLLGIALSLFGFGLAFCAPSDERWKLVLANILLLILTYVSIVAPN